MQPYSQPPAGAYPAPPRTETAMNTATCRSTCARGPSGGRGLSLGGALGYLARSALELHRYRYIRTRILHDSLDRVDRQARGK